MAVLPPPLIQLGEIVAGPLIQFMGHSRRAIDAITGRSIDAITGRSH